MIRYTYINNLVLNIYKMLPKIQFPLDVRKIISYIPNCRYMSYQDFAKINGCSIKDVIQLCESDSGCTHYDILQNRYLILCNQSIQYDNPGRQRWTCGHELGHVVCNHHAISAYEKLSENNLTRMNTAEYEAEADYFAATILSPFPLFKLLDIKSPVGVHYKFGLSIEASAYRYTKYCTWNRTRYKTAWENNMIELYKQKHI